MKKLFTTIKQYDYDSLEAYLKDLPRMREKGYYPVDNLSFNSALLSGKTDFGYTAWFIKSR